MHTQATGRSRSPLRSPTPSWPPPQVRGQPHQEPRLPGPRPHRHAAAQEPHHARHTAAEDKGTACGVQRRLDGGAWPCQHHASTNAVVSLPFSYCVNIRTACMPGKSAPPLLSPLPTTITRLTAWATSCCLWAPRRSRAASATVHKPPASTPPRTGHNTHRSSARTTWRCPPARCYCDVTASTPWRRTTTRRCTHRCGPVNPSGSMLSSFVLH